MRGLTRMAAATAAAWLCLTAAACGTKSSPTAPGAAAVSTQTSQTASEATSEATPSTVAATPTTNTPTPTPTATSTPTPTAPSSTALPDGYDPSRNAAADIAAALKLAAADHKKVLIDFGADWCPDCRVLESTFHSPAVTSMLDEHYHVVAVDVGKFDHNLDVAGRYINLQTSGIPGLVVLKPDGTVSVATNDGSFSNARSMTAGQVLDFLKHWAS